MLTFIVVGLNSAISSDGHLGLCGWQRRARAVQLWHTLWRGDGLGGKRTGRARHVRRSKVQRHSAAGEGTRSPPGWTSSDIPAETHRAQQASRVSGWRVQRCDEADACVRRARRRVPLSHCRPSTTLTNPPRPPSACGGALGSRTMDIRFVGSGVEFSWARRYAQGRSNRHKVFCPSFPKIQCQNRGSTPSLAPGNRSYNSWLPATPLPAKPPLLLALVALVSCAPLARRVRNVAASASSPARHLRFQPVSYEAPSRVCMVD